MVIYLVIFTGLAYKASKWIPKKPLDGDEPEAEDKWRPWMTVTVICLIVLLVLRFG